MALNQFIGLTCEIKSMKDEDILFGKIAAARDERLQIDGPSENFPILDAGMKVKILVNGKTGGFNIFVGWVVSSQKELLVVGNVTNLKEYETRRYFRVNVDLPARAYEMTRDAKPFQVRVKNLSLGGMLLETDHLLRPEAKVKIDPKFFSQEVEWLYATVVRALKTREGMLAYGVDFVDLADWEEQRLCAFLYERQRQEIRKKQGFGFL